MGGAGFSLTAPVLTWVTATDDNTPLFEADFTNLLLNDVGRLQISTDVGFTSPTDYTNTADDQVGEIDALLLAFTTGALADGTYWVRARHERGATVSSWSNVETKTIATVVTPVNTVAPAVTGGAWLYGLLTATNGTWSNVPTSYTYQWTRGGVNIASATSGTYTLVAADRGQNIVCVVTATNAGGSTPQASNTIAVAAAGTNLFSKTEVFSDGFWQLTASVTIGTNDAVAPDGTTTMDDIREVNTTAAHELYNNSAMTITSGQPYCASFFVKPVEDTKCIVNLNIGGGNMRTWFDLTGNGAVLTKHASVTAVIQLIANGIYRISARATSSGTSGFGAFGLAKTDNVDTYAGITGDGAELWGAQFEQANAMTSYSSVA